MSRPYWPGLALVLACFVYAVSPALAQDQDPFPDPGAAMSAGGEDAKDLLGDRALPPDGTPQPGAPNMIMQTENAGVATMSIPGEHQRSHSESHSHSSSTSFSFGLNPAAMGMPVWPFQASVHHGHGKHHGSACSAQQNHQCRGCSISCPEGQAAHCQQGDRGIFTDDSSVICQTDAKCECK